MQVLIVLVTLFFSTSLMSLDYFQYEFNFKDEIKKFSITENGDYEYLNSGTKAGCFSFQGVRRGKFLNFNYKKIKKELEKNTNEKNDRSSILFVFKNKVSVISPNSKALDSIRALMLRATKDETGKMSGVSLEAKRIGRQKLEVSFRKLGKKGQEVVIPRNVNEVFALDDISFVYHRKDQRLQLNKKETIILESKSILPKNGVIRYNDSNLIHHKKGSKKLYSLSLCNEF